LSLKKPPDHRGCVRAAGVVEWQFGVAAAPGVGEAVDAYATDDDAAVALQVGAGVCAGATSVNGSG